MKKEMRKKGMYAQKIKHLTLVQQTDLRATGRRKRHKKIISRH